MSKSTSEAECRGRLTLEDCRRALAVREVFTSVITAEDLMSLYETATGFAQVRCIEAIAVERVMSREVVTIAPEMALVEAAAVMLERHISGLPVVGENGRLLGVLAEADLLKAIGIPCHHPTVTLWESLEHLFVHRAGMQGFRGRVRDHMSVPVITVEAGATLEAAVDLMKKKQIKRLMVVDEAGQLVGVVTRSDIIRVFLTQARELAEQPV
ncbi:MAG: CBS domain-containing protein [Magnetococcales bacterium]|nr:CBS domain-containing protein [Magnetococcales bacterium]